MVAGWPNSRAASARIFALDLLVEGIIRVALQRKDGRSHRRPGAGPVAPRRLRAGVGLF